MNKTLLEVHNLKKYYPIYSGLFRRRVGWVKAVDGIDFSLQEGEVLGIVGESGGGKSTAGRAAIRLIEPTEGSIRFLDKDLLALDRQQMKEMRKHIQIIFQDPYSSLNPRKTIGESIGEALLYHQVVSTKNEQIELVAETLKKVGLPPDAMNRYPHQFSGGQQQRICIGRAIALNPKLIVCDEPVSALDVSIQAQILNLLNELKETLNLSYLFISHDLSIIRHISDRVLVLYYGKVVEQGSVDDIFNNPQNDYTRKLLDAIPRRFPRKVNRHLA
jgi:ABC-type oligopeptide transport system ATPase subunit